MEKIIKVENIKIGVVKKFDKEKGVEVSNDYEYVLLIRDGKRYLDVFDLDKDEKYIVFERLPYSNSTLDGECFGSKLIQVNNYDKSDKKECVVLLNADFSQDFNQSEVPLDDVRNLTLKSNYFIRQRKDYAYDKLKKLDYPIEMLKVIVKDTLQEQQIKKLKKKK